MSREMKSAELEWLGDIPNDWETIPNKHLMKKKKELCPKFNGEDILSLSMKGVYVRDPNDESGKRPATYDGYQYVNDGDLLMCLFDIDVTPRCVGRVYDNGLTSPAYSRMIMNPKRANVDYYYYYYLALDFDKTLLHLSKNMRSSLTETDFGGIKAPVPPITEQRQIVSFLDRKCSAIDTAIEKTKESIEKLEEYKKAVITKAVTKGLDPDVKMKDSGEKCTGEIPSHWGCCKILYVLSMPITDGPHETPVAVDEGIPFVSAEAVSQGNGTIDFDHIWGYVSQEFYEQCCKKYIPQKDDIYMIKSGATTGRIAIVDTDKIFTIWSPLAVLRTNKNKMIAKYLYYYVQSDCYQRQVELGWNYGTQQNIGMRMVERLKICVPPIKEQQDIVAYIDNKISSINTLIAMKQNTINKWEEYKKSLIYYAVTGKIDCRNEVV